MVCIRWWGGAWVFVECGMFGEWALVWRGRLGVGEAIGCLWIVECLESGF